MMQQGSNIDNKVKQRVGSVESLPMSSKSHTSEIELNESPVDENEFPPMYRQRTEDLYEPNSQQEQTKGVTTPTPVLFARGAEEMSTEKSDGDNGGVIIFGGPKTAGTLGD